MSKMLYWAIDPNHKPSTAELRDALITGGEANRRRRMTYGYSPERIGSVGVVPVKGSLYTSDYIRISSYIEMLNEDPEVAVLLLDIDSPGGLVAGSMECASVIRASKKPVYAYIEGMGCSAAYLLASATQKIYSSPSSESGSIGVQASWTNFDGLLGKLGIQKVYFRSKYSDKKNVSPASKEGEASIQKTLDNIWDLFAESVAKGRGVEVNDIIEQFGQGEVFLGKEAQERGLVDEIVENFDACVDVVNTSPVGEGEEIMKFETVAQLTAEYPDLMAQAIEAGAKEAVDARLTAEQERVNALLDLRQYTEDFSVIDTAIKEGHDAQATMKAILEAEKQAKKDKQEAVVKDLEVAAKESEEAVVKQKNLADDGLLTDEEIELARIEEMNKNMEAKE